METAHALWAYAVGLAAFSAVRVMVPAFYSLGMARIPVTISMITIGLTLILYFALMGPLHHAGLALATSLGSVINFTMLFLMLRRKIGGIGGRALARSAGRSCSRPLWPAALRGVWRRRPSTRSGSSG
jgi:putative peptidoglycan lipid II flippase